MKYSVVEEDIGVNYQDCGPWRSYGVDSFGNSLEELMENATVFEVDQDGGELNCYGIDDCPTQEVYNAVIAELKAEITRRDND
jgi:hypothetical protein